MVCLCIFDRYHSRPILLYLDSGREKNMKTFLMAFAAAIIIAVIGSVVLNSVPDSAENAFSSSTGVRLGA